MSTPDPELDAMLDTIMVIGADVDVTEEHTSARIASMAATLLTAPNILTRASALHPTVLQAVKDSGFKVDGKMLDLLEALSVAIEPFMQDVRAIAGSALTQAVVRERDDDGA